MRYAASSLLVALFTLPALGCNAIFGLDRTTLAPDAGAGGGGGGSDAQPLGTCSGQAGPESVNIDNVFCIDSTQVTNAQYAEFYFAVTPQTTQQGPGCDWNTSFNPATNLPSAGSMDDYPVTSVDFCDAWAYCAWAGKRLCAEYNRPSMALDDPTTGEVYHACAGGSRLLPYAYGDESCTGGPTTSGTPWRNTPSACWITSPGGA